MVVATTPEQNQLFHRLTQKNVENSKRCGEKNSLFNPKLHMHFRWKNEEMPPCHVLISGTAVRMFQCSPAQMCRLERSKTVT